MLIPDDYGLGPGIKPDDTIVVAASKIFRYQLDMIRTLEQDVRSGENIEPLHKMRVAIRRIRIAYRVLSSYISKSVISPKMECFQEMGDLLGVVRDFDVFLINADNYKLSLSDPTQNDFEKILAYFNKDREIHRKILLDLLESKWYREFVDEFKQIITNPHNLTKNNETNKPNRVLLCAWEIIRYRFQKLLEFEPISGDERIVRLHKLRISVKAYRYSIEFFEEILGEETKTLIDRLITIQDYLGEINDSNVSCNFIENCLNDNIFISELNVGTIDEAVEYLAYLKNQVTDKVTKFPSIWEVIHQPPFITALEEIS